MTDPIRVLVADDHAVVREGLKLFLDLQEDIEVVGEAVDGADAIAKAADLRPDVVLMDLVMPGTSGVEATLSIKQTDPEAHVLVLTSFLDEDTLRTVLRAGATGYLMKDSHPAEVADAIRAVRRGEPLFHPRVLDMLTREFASSGRTAGSPGAPAGTMTIAFTDIVNSSAIMRALGDEGARPIFRRHDEVVREVIEANHGREIQHLGDGFMLAFASARVAVSCAIAIQRAIHEHATGGVRVRVGMHTGEVVSENHGYFGEAVWLAARIASKAEGGQILVSDLTRRLVGSVCSCRDRGEFTLKGLPGLHRLYEVSWEEDALDAASSPSA